MNRFAFAAAIAAGLLACWSAAAAPPPIEEYGKAPAVTQMQLSPSGEAMAYIASGDGQTRVVISKVSGEVLKVINVGGLKGPGIAWLGDTHVLLETSQTVGTDPGVFIDDKQVLQQSTIIDLATGEVSNVFRGERMIFHATWGYAGYAKVDGREYGYFRGLSLGGAAGSTQHGVNGPATITHGYMDLFAVDLATGGARKVANGSARIGHVWILGAGGTRIGHTEREGRSGAWQLIGDVDSRVVLAEANDPLGDYGIVGLGRTPTSLLVHRPDDTGDWAYMEYDARRADPPQELFKDVLVDYFLSDRETDVILGAVTDELRPRTILFDPALQAKFDKVARAFPGMITNLVSYSRNLDRMIVRTEGPGDSGTYYFIDLPAKKAAAIAWNYPALLQDKVAAVRTVTYKAGDGLEIEGILTLPPGRPEKDLPLVVIPHGGPESHDTARFETWAQAFASRGYAVFQPNFRGSDNKGKAFRDAGFNQWGRRMQTDISDGVAELARQGIVDPKRACIFGASYGGYAALAGVTLQHGLYRCAVAFAGVYDLGEMVSWAGSQAGQVSITTRYWRKFMGADAGADLRSLSPAKLASQADAPILLIHGKDDTTVPLGQSRIMRDALRGAGKPFEYEEIAGEDHYLSIEANSIHVISAAVAFVEKHNPAN